MPTSMRGYPPIHILCFLLVFAAIAVPLQRLTLGRSAVVANILPLAELQNVEEMAWITVRFSHAPQHFILRHETSILLEFRSDVQSPHQWQVKLPIEDQHLSLHLEADWQDSAQQAAISIELEPDNLERSIQTAWSDAGKIDEILEFKWQS